MTDSPRNHLKDVADTVSSWKVVVSVFIACLLAGSGFHAWQSGLARAADVRLVRDQIGPLAGRVLVVESALHNQREDLKVIREQLFEIAKTIGARQVAPQGVQP